ncbi:MAG: porin family protein, partial [Desulfuromonadales bacterium]|nr:porin family protein [Desulfuromonadales bacterium]
GFVEWVDGEQDIKNQYFRSANEEETFNYGLAVRYSFLPESQIRPYVGALVGLAEIDLKTDDGKTVHDGYMYGGTIGAYYFFNDNFALEVFYNRTEQDLDDDDSFPHSGD